MNKNMCTLNFSGKARIFQQGEGICVLGRGVPPSTEGRFVKICVTKYLFVLEWVGVCYVVA